MKKSLLLLTFFILQTYASDQPSAPSTSLKANEQSKAVAQTRENPIKTLFKAICDIDKEQDDKAISTRILERTLDNIELLYVSYPSSQVMDDDTEHKKRDLQKDIASIRDMSLQKMAFIRKLTELMSEDVILIDDLITEISNSSSSEGSLKVLLGSAEAVINHKLGNKPAIDYTFDHLKLDEKIKYLENTLKKLNLVNERARLQDQCNLLLGSHSNEYDKNTVDQISTRITQIENELSKLDEMN